MRHCSPIGWSYDIEGGDPAATDNFLDVEPDTVKEVLADQVLAELIRSAADGALSPFRAVRAVSSSSRTKAALTPTEAAR
jgi:hypothetical protein